MLSILFVIATVVSSINPQWIEDVFEASPDRGSGESEWRVTAIVGAFALVSIAVTRWRWRAIRVG